MKKIILLGMILAGFSVYAQKPCGFKDGLQEGECKHFYPNGNTKEVAIWKKGKLEGKATFYYENGNKKSEGSFKKDFKVGKWTYYYSNGKISGYESYVYRDNMSVLEGEFVMYYPNGKLSEKSYYKDGKLNGDFLVYHENGTLMNAAKVTNGKTNSLKIYSADGKLLADGAMDTFDSKFEKIGDWVYYHKDGKTPEKIIVFREGKKVSERKYKK